jgi:hypothetical protein
MTMAYVPALLFFDPQTGEEKKQAVKQRAITKPKKEKRLFCAACRHPVTHQDERIPVQGAHEHRCTNPHGITYHIGCFHEASRLRRHRRSDDGVHLVSGLCLAHCVVRQLPRASRLALSVRR